MVVESYLPSRTSEPGATGMGNTWGGRRFCRAARAYVDKCYTAVTHSGVDLPVPAGISRKPRFALDVKGRLVSEGVISAVLCDVEKLIGYVYRKQSPIVALY
jgi:hypothetical protein